MKDRHTIAEAGRAPETRGREGPDRTRDGDRRGFALLVSLIAIVGLTALATGGFFLADSERQTATNHHAAVEAYHLANAGLSEYLGSNNGEPATGQVGHYDYPDAGGEADVFAERVGAASGGEKIYRIRSTSTFTGAGGPDVQRTVATLVVLDPSLIPKPPGSISSGAGIQKNGGSGLISGVDNCGVESDRAAVRVPTDPGYDGKTKPLEGDPLIDDTDQPFDFLGDNPKEWWQGMKDGSLITHDHTVKSDDASANWPDLPSPDDGSDEMPVTYVDKNNIELGDNEDGQGLLIIKGNATFKGQFDWDGMIIVGGSVTDHGQGQIRGAVMTGLNVLEGDDVSQDDLEDVDTLDGTKKYLFDSCILEDVQNAAASLDEVPSSWHEVF